MDDVVKRALEVFEERIKWLKYIKILKSL
jgi:hypothetical protein